ncbi:hypothetical protein JHJ32_10225 [Parapedobacter sp. ISTM3]|uniref:hypothetical protein n=1 Tax=Parapedobacter sp. ISTM3 TaxID=2800130 RepID=UPI001903768B|nr:hypothetical protein [Parapedobacter sp. ISTM3]MBK1440361.1 hypothetical protein [Parapedobacter sp. ISTM3]
MNWIDTKCTVLCLLVVASASCADTNGNTHGNQPNTLALLASHIAALQQEANRSRYGAGEDEMRLLFTRDNFCMTANGRFRYRAIFTKQGETPAVIDKTVNFTNIASIYPLPVSRGGVGALMICYGTGDTVSFFYKNSGTSDGKLLGAVLDLVYHVNKANGINLDALFFDWEIYVKRKQTYDSISQFIAKHPDSFLTAFAWMVRDKKQRQRD